MSKTAPLGPGDIETVGRHPCGIFWSGNDGSTQEAIVLRRLMTIAVTVALVSGVSIAPVLATDWMR